MNINSINETAVISQQSINHKDGFPALYLFVAVAKVGRIVHFQGHGRGVCVTYPYMGFTLVVANFEGVGAVAVHLHHIWSYTISNLLYSFCLFALGFVVGMALNLWGCILYMGVLLYCWALSAAVYGTILHIVQIMCKMVKE